MVNRAREYGMRALAITDHGALFGAVEFYDRCREAGVKPIIGIETYVTRGNRSERRREDETVIVPGRPRPASQTALVAAVVWPRESIRS